MEDQLTWAADKRGRFTITPAVNLLRPHEDDATTGWQWMWKLQLPQRLKLFLWILLHGKLLTNAERFRRRLSSSPICDCCLHDVEDLEHLFRSCPAAVAVWRELQARGRSFLGGEEALKLWLNRNLRSSCENPDWSTEFMVTLWYIWK